MRRCNPGWSGGKLNELSSPSCSERVWFPPLGRLLLTFPVHERYIVIQTLNVILTVQGGAVSNGTSVMSNIRAPIKRTVIEHLGLQMRLYWRLAIVKKYLPGTVLQNCHSGRFKIAARNRRQLACVLRRCRRWVQECIPIVLTAGSFQSDSGWKRPVQTGEEFRIGCKQLMFGVGRSR